MADIIVNNLPLNVAPVGEDVLLLIKNSDGTLTRVPVGNLSSITGDVFWVTYGTTTYSEIHDALQDNKILACNYNDRVYIYQKEEPLLHQGEYEYIFTAPEEDGTISWVKYSMSTSAWSAGSVETAEIVWLTYGTTTYSEIRDALLANKEMVCNYNNREYRYTKKSPVQVSDQYELTFTAPEEDGTISWVKYNMWTLTWSSGTTHIHGIPSGGTTNQVLKKSSGADYDVEWANESGGGGSSPSPYTSNPAALGTASPGSSDNYARGDHVHPLPFIPVAGSSNPAALGTASPGVSLYYSAADHVHPKPTASDIGAIAAPVSASNGQFLMWNGSAWVASSLPTYNGEVS